MAVPFFVFRADFLWLAARNEPLCRSRQDKNMKRLRNHLIGIDQGHAILFKDFQDGGEMWTGEGPREKRQAIAFAEPFRTEPSVQVSVSLWDVDTGAHMRADVSAEAVTRKGFDIVFRTWGDSRIARVRVSWMAIGELVDDDQWELD